MGFGIPAAMAAQLNNPDADSLYAYAGDGGFLMMAGEIITLQRYNLSCYCRSIL